MYRNTSMVLRRAAGGQKGGQKGGRQLTARQEEVLALIMEKPGITRDELANALGINPSAVQKHMAALKNKGVLTRVGGDKGGYWQVKG